METWRKQELANKLLENWLSLTSTLEEAPKQVHKPLEVMGLFEGVSKVVPLWRSSKHGPHKKTLCRSLGSLVKKPRKCGNKTP